jgi:hypothetical protein
MNTKNRITQPPKFTEQLPREITRKGNERVQFLDAVQNEQLVYIRKLPSHSRPPEVVRATSKHPTFETQTDRPPVYDQVQKVFLDRDPFRKFDPLASWKHIISRQVPAQILGQAKELPGDLFWTCKKGCRTSILKSEGPFLGNALE